MSLQGNETKSLLTERVLLTADTRQSHGSPGSTVLAWLSRIMLPVALGAFLAPFFLLFFYSVPAADDFCNASLSFNMVPQPSVTALTWLYYTRWSPRWLTYFLLGHALSHGDILRTYGWLLLLVALTNLAALWYFCATAFNLPRGKAFLAAAVFYTAWIVALGSPDQQLYWLTNVVVYSFPLSTLLVLLSLLLRPRRTAWYYGVVVLLAIAVPAQQEIAGTFLCLIAFVAAVCWIVRRLPGNHWYLTLLASTISTAVVVLSPGNAIRAAAEHKHLWDIAHFPRWTAHAFYHGLDWLSVPAVLVGALCILMICQSRRDLDVSAGPPPRWVAIAGLAGMLAVLCECAWIEMATSSWLPDRVVMWFQFVFWLLLVCVVAAGAPEIYRVRFSSITRLAVSTLFSATLLTSANFRSAVSDIRGPAQSWWRVEASRLRQRGSSLEYEAPAQYPKLAKPQMLTDDSGCWVNRCLANYLHAPTVLVTHSKEECPH